MKRIFALLLSLAVLFSCLAVTAGAMFDPSTVYDVKAQSAFISLLICDIIISDISSWDMPCMKKTARSRCPPGA